MDLLTFKEKDSILSARSNKWRAQAGAVTSAVSAESLVVSSTEASAAASGAAGTAAAERGSQTVSLTIVAGG